VLKKKTCAENPEEFLILSCCLQHFQHNSGKAMHQNGTTIKYKILTKHCNDPACLQHETITCANGAYMTSWQNICLKELADIPYKISPQISLLVQSSETWLN
jgi:hypothetical protein